MFTLNTPLNTITSLKPFHLTRLKRLGILTISDLLWHFPTRYDDFSHCVPIDQIAVGEHCTIQGVVKTFSSKKSWKKKLLISEAVFEDETGSVHALWFGRKFLETLLIPGKPIRLSGKAIEKNGEIVFQSPECENAYRDATHTGGLVAIYPETEGLTSKWLRWQIQTILRKTSFPKDPLPESLRSRLHLPSQEKAFHFIHTPASREHSILAQKYFAFEEMFILQLYSFHQKRIRSTDSSITLSDGTDSTSDFLPTLPFTLTDDQQSAVSQIFTDFSKPHPMNRLLNGDVGSGKTVVAAIAARQVSLKGYQTALLAPTEVLALQHFHSFRALLRKENISIGLLTHSYQYIAYPGHTNFESVRRSQFLNALKAGLIDTIVGTHAIIQKDIEFRNLAFVIIDEQHRFGVRQRAHLTRLMHTDKNTKEEPLSSEGQSNSTPRENPKKFTYTPHLLTMTATPIPRTLSLTVFGNLDISLLETMPKNRLPIITKIIPPEKREGTYNFIKKQISQNRQGFVILPFVEESDAILNVKAAITEHARLQKDIFPDLRLGLLHGRMKSSEKESIMHDFTEGRIDLLVSTSVVEVGVDIPNATVMIIENADRFGLSQLHQFRGRIGRGTEQSYCFLFSSEDSLSASKRMRILERTLNGFVIAEEDMKLRGPGQFLGTRQSGIPDMAMENMGNMKLITLAKKEAETLLKDDPHLTCSPSLQDALTAFDADVHME